MVRRSIRGLITLYVRSFVENAHLNKYNVNIANGVFYGNCNSIQRLIKNRASTHTLFSRAELSKRYVPKTSI